MKRVRVMAAGTFDLLHPGHVYYLQQAKRLGTHLIVVVARDKTVLRMKKRRPVFNERHRLHMVRALKPVSKAVFGSSNGRMLDIVRKVNPQVIALGYDQWPNEKRMRMQLAEMGLHPRIVRVRAKRPREWKSSRIRARVRIKG